MIRFILNLFIFFSIFFLPQPISIVINIAIIFIIPDFIEAIFWAFLIDVLYGSGYIFGYNFGYFITILTLLIFLISFRFKNMLIFYSRT